MSNVNVPVNGALPPLPHTAVVQVSPYVNEPAPSFETGDEASSANPVVRFVMSELVSFGRLESRLNVNGSRPVLTIPALVPLRS